jgi:hypothetical protein
MLHRKKDVDARDRRGHDVEVLCLESRLLVGVRKFE